MLSILTLIFKSLTIFSGSYSNNVFKKPLSKKEEDKQIKLLLGETATNYSDAMI